MKGKKEKDVYIKPITMIDSATTGWIEIRSVPEARADLVDNQVELAWLTRYPLHKISVDRGKELLAEFTTMMANDYGIPHTVTTGIW